jgi:hypothetical protein
MFGCTQHNSKTKACVQLFAYRAVAAAIGVDLSNMVKRAHLREIVRSIDPTLDLDADTEQVLLDMCDDFIEDVSWALWDDRLSLACSWLCTPSTSPLHVTANV